MTELQYGLIGLGVAAIAGVLAYNKWQERAHRKVAEKLLKAEHGDALMGAADEGKAPVAARTRSEPTDAGHRREPVLAGGEARDDETSAPDFAAVPVVEMSEPLPEQEAMQVEEEVSDAVDAGPVPTGLLDPKIDFIVAMELVDGVTAAQIRHSQQEALSRVAKPISWIGFNERSREWERMADDGTLRYRRLRIGLQLADRQGPLADADFAVFTTAIRQLADELLAIADMPPERAVLSQALALDRFSADVDLEIGVNLVSRSAPFSGTKLRALAEAAGMVLGANGMFTRYDDQGRAMFSLQNLEPAPFIAETIKTQSTHGLTFLLDVPRVDQGERAFAQMLDLARRFGDALQGTLVDDNRQPLTDVQLDRIKREYVAKPQAAMAAYGIAAGSPQALRLFS